MQRKQFHLVFLVFFFLNFLYDMTELIGFDTHLGIVCQIYKCLHKWQKYNLYTVKYINQYISNGSTDEG